MNNPQHDPVTAQWSLLAALMVIGRPTNEVERAIASISAFIVPAGSASSPRRDSALRDFCAAANSLFPASIRFAARARASRNTSLASPRLTKRSPESRSAGPTLTAPSMTTPPP